LYQVKTLLIWTVISSWSTAIQY